jgi:hypothetical protein
MVDLIVYKDALEYEFKKRSISYEREKKYSANYKDIILPHRLWNIKDWFYKI